MPEGVLESYEYSGSGITNGDIAVKTFVQSSGA